MFFILNIKHTLYVNMLLDKILMYTFKIYNIIIQYFIFSNILKIYVLKYKKYFSLPIDICFLCPFVSLSALPFL